MASRLAFRAARIGKVARPLWSSGLCSSVPPSHPASSLAQQRRFISSEAENLRGLLERELGVEEGEAAPMPEAPEGFSLLDSGDSKGDIRIRSTVGDEEITVTIEMPTQLRFDESPNLNFLVHCHRKGKGVLEFTCVSEVETDPSGSGETNHYSNYTILGVKMYAEKDVSPDTVLGESAEADYVCEQQYSGPCLTDLEVDLQTGFREFLWERNVDEKVMQFMQYAVPAKESKLYRHWMKAGIDYCT